MGNAGNKQMEGNNVRINEDTSFDEIPQDILARVDRISAATVELTDDRAPHLPTSALRAAKRRFRKLDAQRDRKNRSIHPRNGDFSPILIEQVTQALEQDIVEPNLEVALQELLEKQAKAKQEGTTHDGVMFSPLLTIHQMARELINHGLKDFQKYPAVLREAVNREAQKIITEEATQN